MVVWPLWQRISAKYVSRIKSASVYDEVPTQILCLSEVKSSRKVAPHGITYYQSIDIIL